MSFIDLNVTDAKEARVAPEGIYTHRIHEATIEDGKKPGTKNIRVMTIIEGEDEFAPVFTYLSLPNSQDDEKAKNFKKLQIRRFLHAFNIPYDPSGFNVEDFAGATGDVLTVVEVYEGRESNKLQLPRLPDELE